MNQNIQTLDTKFKSPRKCPVYFWRPWYPPSTFSKLFYGFDKLFNEKYVKNTIYELECELKNYFDCDYVLFTPSGTASIFLACKITLTQKEIILPSLVCDVVPFAVQQSGNSMNFIDVDPLTYNIDENAILNTISSRTGAILAVHQFGFPCHMNAITDIAEDKNCIVIEDAAQSFGAEYNNKKVGTIGDVGIFSFNNKVLDACGGGLIVTNNQQYYQKMNEIARSRYSLDFTRKRILRNLIRSWLLSDYPGIGFAIGDLFKKELIPDLTETINPLTPLLLKNSLPEIENIVNIRRKNFNCYLSNLSGKNLIKPAWQYQQKPSFTFCTIRFGDSDTRNTIKTKLLERGIRSEVLAQPTHHKFNPKSELPMTELVANTMLSFPTDPHLDQKQILCVTNMINRFLAYVPDQPQRS